jgi:hypothetical protein
MSLTAPGAAHAGQRGRGKSRLRPHGRQRDLADQAAARPRVFERRQGKLAEILSGLCCTSVTGSVCRCASARAAELAQHRAQLAVRALLARASVSQVAQQVLLARANVYQVCSPWCASLTSLNFEIYRRSGSSRGGYNSLFSAGSLMREPASRADAAGGRAIASPFHP